MTPGLIGFVIAIVVHRKLKHQVDRDKVMQLTDMAELFPNSIPPKKVLTDQGRRSLRWFRVGMGVLIGNMLLIIFLYR
ncbi:MAG: hypothetical protein U1F81_10185 [Verrucomicrobiaceae bacterium]